MNMNAPLSTPTSSGGRSGVVGGDLLAELGDALLQLRRRGTTTAPSTGPVTGVTVAASSAGPAVPGASTRRPPASSRGARARRARRRGPARPRRATAAARRASAGRPGAPTRDARRASDARRRLGRRRPRPAARHRARRESASARSTSAWRASTGTRSRPRAVATARAAPRGGSSSAGARGSSFDRVVDRDEPERVARAPRTSARRTPSSGRTTVPRRAGMPAEPARRRCPAGG